MMGRSVLSFNVPRSAGSGDWPPGDAPSPSKSSTIARRASDGVRVSARCRAGCLLDESSGLLPMGASCQRHPGAQAGSFPSVLAAYVRDHVDDRAFSRAFATMMLFFSVTAIIGPVIIGALADATGSFQVPYLVLAAAAAATLVSVSLLPRNAD